jgi:hypothetical protein
MHDLASSLAQNEFSIISSQNHRFSKTTRHLSVIDSNFFFHRILPKFSNEFDHVRSILFADIIVGPTCKTDFEKCLSGFKHLRRIGALKHLRYLHFFWNTEMTRLPKSLFKLQNLQALVVGAKGLEELPKDVRYMINLRFLFLVTQQKRLPEGGIGFYTFFYVKISKLCAKICMVLNVFENCLLLDVIA